MIQKSDVKLNPICTTGIKGIDGRYNEVFLLYNRSLLDNLEKIGLSTITAPSARILAG